MLDYNDTKTRASLAQTLAVKCDDSEPCPAFTLVANHFKSKGSDCEDVGDPDLNDGQVSQACRRRCPVTVHGVVIRAVGNDESWDGYLALPALGRIGWMHRGAFAWSSVPSSLWGQAASHGALGTRCPLFRTNTSRPPGFFGCSNPLGDVDRTLASNALPAWHPRWTSAAHQVPGDSLYGQS